MDLGNLQNVVREAVTVVSFVIFLGVIFWAYSHRRKEAYEEMSHLPLEDEDFSGSSSHTDATHTIRNAS